jgi:Protein of unknown function (DUF1302)
MTTMKTLKPVAAAVLAMTLAGAAQAGETVEFDNGLKLDWRLNTTYTLSQRLKNADPVLAGNKGGNDGDNNFAKNALTANRLSALFEGKVYKGDTGFVLSASTFYDDVYHRTNDNKPSAANPNGLNKAAPYNEFTDEAKKYHGGYSRILDAYGYTSFGLGESSRATVRAGRHAVNWGEAVYFPNIAMAQGPFDGTKTGVPGTETKDSILPEDQISASIEVTPRWTLLGQAQFGFHPTLAAAPGSYMSSSDGVGPGGTCLGPYTAIPAISAMGFGGYSGCSFGKRGADIEPGKTGQWGIGTRYRLTDETEVGAYYLNYQDRTPVPEINAFTSGTAIPAALQASFGGIKQIGNGSYNVRYFDNIKLLGGTVSTTFGPISAYGELTYKEGAPVLVDAVVNPATGATMATPTRANISQLNIGGFYNIGRTPIADSVQLLGEITALNISGVKARQAIGSEAYPAAYGFAPSQKLSFQSNSALAISGTLVLGYPGIFEGWDLTVPISYSQQLKGRTLVGGVGGEGDKRYSVGASFTRKGNLSVGVTYLGYLGGASLAPLTNRLVSDRDQLSVTMKYAF